MRINSLYKYALKGESESQLLERAIGWGVTKSTATSYLASVKVMLKKTGRAIQ